MVDATDRWLRHLLFERELQGGVASIFAIRDYLRRIQRAGAQRWEISGRLHSIAKGTIRSRAQQVAAEQQAATGKQAEFRGIVIGSVGDIRAFHEGDVDESGRPADAAHSNLFFAAVPLVEGLISLRFCNDLLAILQFIAPNSDEMAALD
jgi:hypothetical protein